MDYRTHLRNIGLAAFAGVLCAAGCGGAAANSFSPNVPAGPMPSGGEWSGVYYSDWGRMELQQTGDTVVGEFRSDIKRGRISGQVRGNELTFQFTQDDETVPGRTRTFQGTGQFRYFIDTNGDHKLGGSWGYGSLNDDGGPWNATRSRRARFQLLAVPDQPAPTEEGDGSTTTPDATQPTQPRPTPQPGQPTGDEDALGDL